MTLSMLLTRVFLFASTLVVLVFILAYHTMARWEKTPMGRHLMTFSVLTFLVLLQVCFTLVFGTYPGKVIIAPFTYAGFCFAWTWRLMLFIKSNREARLKLSTNMEDSDEVSA